MVSKAETQAVCSLCSLKAQKAHTLSTAEGRAYLKVACPTSDCDIRASPCFCLSNYICLFTSSGGAELAGVGCGCVLCAVCCVAAKKAQLDQSWLPRVGGCGELCTPHLATLQKRGLSCHYGLKVFGVYIMPHVRPGLHFK